MVSVTAEIIITLHSVIDSRAENKLYHSPAIRNTPFGSCRECRFTNKQTAKNLNIFYLINFLSCYLQKKNYVTHLLYLVSKIKGLHLISYIFVISDLIDLCLRDRIKMLLSSCVSSSILTSPPWNKIKWVRRGGGGGGGVFKLHRYKIRHGHV